MRGQEDSGTARGLSHIHEVQDQVPAWMRLKGRGNKVENKVVHPERCEGDRSASGKWDQNVTLICGALLSVMGPQVSS